MTDLPTGFVDLQVNGYAGVDFNQDELSVDRIRFACDRLRNDGVASILATIITDDISKMCHRLSQVAVALEADSLIREVIGGFHIEGPFLNETPGFIGAHPTCHAKAANLDDMKRLLDAAADKTRIVTLAPERDPQSKVTQFLSQNDIVVSAGHCDPSLDELKAGIDAGLSMFTHLGNGCPLQLHRHDNIVQRVLSCSDQLRIGFIADGVHIPLFALKNYLKCADCNRCFVVTDAIAAAGKGPGVYELAGQTVVVDENLATWAEDRSHLVGSASTMPSIVANLRRIGLDETTIRKLAITNPRAALATD